MAAVGTAAAHEKRGVIMGVDRLLSVGARTNPIKILDAFGEMHDGQPVYVVRRATRQEWEAEVRAAGGVPYAGDSRYFYEVLTD